MATLFKEVSYNLNTLIQNVHMGIIGLPEIQRPFVWEDTKVRDLFDSMYRGYPVGHLLFWSNKMQGDDKRIGAGEKQKHPDLLIVDGQQRLTSLYAVIKGIPVLRENYKTESIEIAFKPSEQLFEVADAAIRRSPEYIHNISVLWHQDTNLFQFVNDFLHRLRDGREVGQDEERKIQESINRLKQLESYPFTALELSPDINEESVADVFVRINSAGKSLSQADFILTLMSVFWDEGRADLEAFCRQAREPGGGEASAFNYHLQPFPDQLMRVSIGLGFHRGRLQHVYNILRGKDLDTGEFSVERRDRQFAILKQAQSHMLDLQNWHEFLKALLYAGFLHADMISSQNTVLYSYVLYLIGRQDFAVEHGALRVAIARWFFMTALTSRYTGSFETKVEQDLGLFAGAKSGKEYLSQLNRIISDSLTSDYWSITLPNELATSSPKSPALFAYYAALNILNADVLFSKLKVSDLFKADIHAKKSALERHHIFPKAYLQRSGITDNKKINQIANFALVEWPDNIDISDDPPSKYFPPLRARYNDAELGSLYHLHALPDGWENLEYEKFLEQRRLLMARVIREAFEKLSA